MLMDILPCNLNPTLSRVHLHYPFRYLCER
jgi:hypothetical protein